MKNIKLPILRKKYETGAVLILLPFLIILLMIILGYGFFTTNYRLAKEELQTALDAAALAATKELCHSEACWSRAQVTAINTLGLYEVRNILGVKKPIHEYSLSSSEGYFDIVGNFRPGSKPAIKIERGHWAMTDRNPQGEFISLEAADIVIDGVVYQKPWSHLYPGVPRTMAANAVNIEVTLSSTFSGFGFLTGSTTTKTNNIATAVSARGSLSSECIAPFAIPVCALLDQNGEFDAARNCSADRFFTRSDRYCDQGVPSTHDDCGIRPAFIYNIETPTQAKYLNADLPPDEKIIECAIDYDLPRPLAHYDWLAPENLAVYGLENRPQADEMPYGWCNQSFTSTQDHFGVIGLPNPEGKLINLDHVLRAISPNKATDCTTAHIGERFSILEEGFKYAPYPSMENAILERIKGLNSVASGNPPTTLGKLDFPIELTAPNNSNDLQEPGGYLLLSDVVIETPRNKRVSCSQQGKTPKQCPNGNEHSNRGCVLRAEPDELGDCWDCSDCENCKTDLCEPQECEQPYSLDQSCQCKWNNSTCSWQECEQGERCYSLPENPGQQEEFQEEFEYEYGGGRSQLNPSAGINITVTNQLSRSSNVGGLCRSLRAELRCAQLKEAAEALESIDQLNFNSIHAPANVEFIEIPDPDTLTELANVLKDYACNLDSYRPDGTTNHFENYLQQVGNKLRELHTGCADGSIQGELCRLSPSLEDLENRLVNSDNKGDLSPNSSDTRGAYMNLKVFPKNEITKDQYWFAKIPVIANFSAKQGCALEAGAVTADPAIDPKPLSSDWRIIGFVDAQIFDADITGTYVRNEWGTPIQNVAGNMAGPFPIADSDGRYLRQGPKNWYFSINDMNASPCNLVRARVACGTNFIATPENSFENEKLTPALRR